MNTYPFVFQSANLPKLKAKQLSKAFPFLKLATAQELTARALGYLSWYECIHKGSKGSSSLPDQTAGLPARILRYYHQTNVLISAGISPAEADLWVRAWGLTGESTFSPSMAIPLYYRWDKLLTRFEQGEIDEEHLIELADLDGYPSKYPDIERPERVCPGVLLGPMGKYPHHVLNHDSASKIPSYLRGAKSAFHIEDDYDLLSEFIDGFKTDDDKSNFANALNPIQYEWCFGGKHPNAQEHLLPRLISEAMSKPNEMMIISTRPMPIPNGEYDFNKLALACLSGKDFSNFLKNKGAINPDSVVWFENIESNSGNHGFDHDWFGMLLGSPSWSKTELPIFKVDKGVSPCLPLYSYPFKISPMSAEEYNTSSDCGNILPLGEDYDDEDGDDNDDDEDPPEHPNGPDPSYLSLLETA